MTDMKKGALLMDKVIAELQKKLESRELDHFYADSWEQAVKISEDIEKIQAELKSLKDMENGQRSM